jgi:hypothetical protein
MRWIFLAVSILCCGILIPINVTFNAKFIPEERRDTLGVLTIQNLSGFWLFAHVAMTYLINGIVLAFIYYNWKAMVALRRTWFVRMSTKSPFTLGRSWSWAWSVNTGSKPYWLSY